MIFSMARWLTGAEQYEEQWACPKHADGPPAGGREGPTHSSLNQINTIFDPNSNTEGKVITCVIARKQVWVNFLSRWMRIWSSLQSGEIKQGSIKALNLGCQKQYKYRKESRNLGDASSIIKNQNKTTSTGFNRQVSSVCQPQNLWCGLKLRWQIHGLGRWRWLSVISLYSRQIRPFAEWRIQYLMPLLLAEYFCPHPQFIGWNPNPHGDGIGRWGLWEVIRSCDPFYKALIPFMRDPKGSPVPACCGDRAKDGPPSFPPRGTVCGGLGLGLPSLLKCEKSSFVV